MKMASRFVLLTLCSSLLLLAPAFAQAPPGQPQAQQNSPDLIKQGQQLMREGKLDGALAMFRQTLRAWPNSMVANIAAGSDLDLMGRGDEARKYFQKAIDVADTPEHKAVAQRQMAISYAFEGNCAKAPESEQQALNYYASLKDYFQQGEAASETGRICLDAGDLDAAYKWYRLGHEIGLQDPDAKPALTDLWEFRWEHVQARIAARRGDHADAEKHVAAAGAILDKGTNPDQAQFLPFLKGYVAFYDGDYKPALDEFSRSNENDPFIVCMTGQTYEKLGEKDRAHEYYVKAESAIIHTPQAAYAVFFSRKKLAESGN